MIEFLFVVLLVEAVMALACVIVIALFKIRELDHIASRQPSER